MAHRHNPIWHTSLLRQALDLPKRPIGIFLGAGCPYSIKSSDGEPLIPDIKGMTSVVDKKIEQSKLAAAFTIIQKHYSEASGGSANIESYLSYIRTLREVASSVTIKELTPKTLESLETTICEEVYNLANVSLEGKSSSFHHLASWIKGTPRHSPVELFTTNYDLLIEQALEDLRAPYFDGFIGSREAFFDPYSIETEESKLPPRWARLWKLHGSINWWSKSHGKGLEILRSSSQNLGDRRLIHPSHLKYDESRQMPYLAMMDKLKTLLKKPAAVLVICGYSFGDRHINALIRQALDGNQDAMAFGLLFGSLSNYTEAGKLAQMTPNLSLLAKNEAIIGTKKAAWEIVDNGQPLPPGVTITEKEGKTESEVLFGDFFQFSLLLQDLIGGQAAQEEIQMDATNVK